MRIAGLTLTAAALAIAAPGIADAQFYLGGGAGYSRATEDNADFTFTANPPGSGTAEVGSQNGLALIGQIGYQFASGLRLEVEPGYRRHGGDLSALSMMGNALFGFGQGAFRPYIGVGVGGVRVSAEGSRTLPNGTTTVTVDSDDWSPAVQGIVGVGYHMSPNVVLGLDYRYLAARESDLSASAVAPVSTGNADYRYRTHTVLASVRYLFSAPPPPPPPPVAAPAPAAVRLTQTFLVFFDFDSAELTPAARDTISTAVNAVRAGGVARIQIVGHTDTSGSPAYNERLGQRRADAVQGEMVRQGLPASIIATRSAGETELRVRTADGVREAQNRRAEIILPGG